LAKLSGAVKTILDCVGEDSNREGLLKTPERYAKALMFFTKGYEESLHCMRIMPPHHGFPYEEEDSF